MSHAATTRPAAPLPLALAMPLALALAACTADGRDGTSLENSIQPQGRFVALAPDASHDAVRAPLAALPAEAGATAGVKSRAYVDGLRQDIALSGGGARGIANGLTVLVRTTRQPTLDEAVPLQKPTEGAIRSEIGAQFPKVPMQVLERPSANTYGPYGLALGRAPGNVRCAYMWQWIDANRLPRGADLVGPASVRVRLCRADMSFDAMAAAMDHLVIAPQGAAAPPADPARAAVPEAAAAQVIVAAEAEAPPAVEAERAPRRRPHRTVRHHPRPVPSAPREAVAPPAGDGPRYMAQTTAPTMATPTMAAPTTAAPASAPRLPSDLPPQAYLGPGFKPN